MLRGFAFTHRITDMSLAAIIETRSAAIRRLVSRHRAANPRLFGSVLRGADGRDSDIDILVDALPGATLFDLGGLQQDLQDLLGAPVDLLTPRDLPQTFRDRVLAEARPI